MKKKIYSISGVTLIEILIGIIITTIMMAAMYASYSAVNNTYRQVADRAKISQAGRDVVGMIANDVRMAGFKYFNDDIQTSDEHAPIIITKSTNFTQECDKIEIVFGDVNYDPSGTPSKYTYERFKTTYQCKKSTVQNRAAKPSGSGVYPTIEAFAVYKSKVKWNTAAKAWWDPDLDGDNRTYNDQLVEDYIEDLIFNAVDDKGLVIKPPPTPKNSTRDKLYKIKTVDILLNVRSKKEFYRRADLRDFFGLGDTTRDGTGKNLKAKADRYLRDTIVVSAHARNLGLQ